MIRKQSNAFEHNKHTVNSNGSRRKVIPPLEFTTGSGSDLWAELYRSKSSQPHLRNPTQLNSRKTQRYRTSLMWFWMSAIYPPPLHLCFLFPFLPTSSGSLTVSGCNLALTCPDQHISRERSTDQGSRGVEDRSDGVDEGRGGVEGKREGKAGAGWRLVEKWKRSENGRGGGMEARGDWREKEEQIKRVLISI